jgi:hypothetical protein
MNTEWQKSQVNLKYFLVLTGMLKLPVDLYKASQRRELCIEHF